MGFQKDNGPATSTNFAKKELIEKALDGWTYHTFIQGLEVQHDLQGYWRVKRKLRKLYA
jgi:hypothetical protein